MKYAYPAIFTPLGDDGYDVVIPDLSGCRTCGKDLADAIEMAEDAISMWLWDAENEKETIPQASKTFEIELSQFISFIKADTDAYRRQHDTKAVKKTLSIPNWLNAEAERVNAPYSQILQQGLKDYLGLANK